ncbi:dynein axonemal intermediate chain 3 [Centrocercus urophasianus]|uniref:dynein axonemal intermediate chain 3 n=1 Tax=Centrocercus urophasianus TaxID=9002 RepID=UPI001C648C97|nr:dynein axonemal intermediate chain 3 [Centrocercus urophasianus]
MPKNLKSGKTTLKGPKPSAKKQRSGETKQASKEQKQPEKKDEVDLSMVGIGHPEIFPLVFTTRTQEIFNCRVDEDVTEENCFKLIKKDDIIQDLKTRAAISDFHPVKNIVLEYPGEELLIVFDANFQYGQNFYLVASEEAKENFLKPPETAEEMDSEEEKEETPEVCAYKPPVSKPWVSLGSEKEVEEESVKERVKKIKYMFSRGHRKFGAPITFTDRNASHEKDSYVECTSYQDKSFSIKVLEKDVGVQMVPEVRESSTQTQWTYPKNAATQYFPRQLSNEEKEEILSSEKLKQFLTSVCLRMEIALQQNEIMDAFSDDWKALDDDMSSSGGKSDICLKAYQTFTDLHYLKDKSISCICWHPTIYGIIAESAIKRPSKEERTKPQHDSVIIFWSFFDPIHPQLILECLDDIYCFQFNPSDPNIIAGGCFSGQVVVWDISQYEEKLQNAKSVAVGMKKTVVNMNNISDLSLLENDDMSELLFTEDDESDKGQILVRHCTASSIHHSHEKRITDIHWLPDYFEVNRMGETFENRAGICVQLVTCSPDSLILFWDIRDTKLPTKRSSEKLKEGNSFNMHPEVSDTSNDPDLIWKPLMKISLCDNEDENNVKCNPTKISLQEQHYHYKITDKEQSLHKSHVKESPHAQKSISSNKTLNVLENISNNFIVGTEDGDIVYSNWEMKTSSNEEKIASKFKFLGKKCTIHKEAVNTVQRSPFFKDIILSVGGWNFAIWKEGVTNGLILQSNCTAQRYTAGHWSLTRPGVFYIATDDGNIDIWDLLKETHKPSHSQNISKSAITCISPWVASPKQQFLAVSDDSGVLHVLEIRRTLSHPSSSEWALMNLRLMGHIVQRSLTEKLALPSSHKRYLKEIQRTASRIPQF